MKIYFIRHGEAYHNLYNNGNNNWHLEFPRLTVKGINQCHEVKKLNLNVDVILVSPLRRTLETAENIFDKSNKFIALDEIKEFVANPCDRRETVNVIIKYFDYVNFSNISDDYEINKKETEDDISIRMEKFYNYLKTLKYKSIAVVTHGAFLKRFINKYGEKLNISSNDSYFKNCEVKTGELINF
jgi:broad specificity phosphatase PhoE